MVHFDISDFLLSGLRHPILLLMPLMWTILIICFRTILQQKHFYVISIFVAILVTIGAPILTANIKISSCGQLIVIDFKEGAGSTDEATPRLTDKNACWLLYGSTNKAIITEKFRVKVPLSPCSTPLDQGYVSQGFMAIALDSINGMSFQNSRPRGGTKLKCVFFQ